nr:MAG TPA: FERRITIN TRANSPORT, IRON-STORAGE PROTEIN, IRON [Caudoviricetes sp.]
MNSGAPNHRGTHRGKHVGGTCPHWSGERWPIKSARTA